MITPEIKTRVINIYKVFEDYYGEDRVDLVLPVQDSNTSYIIIHFPEVTITNEYNNSIDIKDLFVRVELVEDKHLIFKLIKSTYSNYEFINGYIHSHVSSLISSRLDEWKNPCLGTGPIKRTVSTLSLNYDLNVWLLFCRELDLYVATESLSGGPYLRLDTIKSNTKTRVCNEPCINHGDRNIVKSDVMKSFITEVLKNTDFKLNFNGYFNIASDWFNYYINISNLFIDYCNNNKITLNQSLKRNYLREYTIKNRIIYNGNNTSIPTSDDITVLIFKGKPITLKIYNNNSIQYNYLLNITVASYILKALILSINYNYEESNRTNRCIYLV